MVLISPQFTRHTKAALALDDDKVLTYFINNTDGRLITTVPHTPDEVLFIETMFDGLNQYLDIDFERATSGKASDIDFYSIVK